MVVEMKKIVGIQIHKKRVCDTLRRRGGDNGYVYRRGFTRMGQAQTEKKVKFILFMSLKIIPKTR